MTRYLGFVVACLCALGAIAIACRQPGETPGATPDATKAEATPVTPAEKSPTPATSPSPTLAHPPVVTTTFEASPPANLDCADFPSAPLPVRRMEIVDGERRLVAEVEVADSDSERARGLMCRMRLEAGTGMAFLWETPVGGGFWMYNTYVPLDLVYVAGEGRVVAVRSMKPCPRGSGEVQQTWRNRCIEESRPYAPDAMYELAVELPAGWLQESGFDPAGSARWSVTLK